MTKREIQKLIFHEDTLVLIAALVFLWFTISLVLDNKTNKANLLPHTGQLVKIDSVITRIKDKPLFKQITKELRLTLDTEPDHYTSITTKHFGNITSKLKLGDTVTIYTKPKVWGIFGLKKGNDISHLSKGDTIIIDIENYKKSISRSYVLTLIATLFFIIIYCFRFRRRYIIDFNKEPHLTEKQHTTLP